MKKIEHLFIEMLYLSVIFHLIHVCSYIDIPSWKTFLMYLFEISQQVLTRKIPK